MTNLNTKVVRFNIKVIGLAIAALAITLAGCKKDEEYGSLVLDTYSMDFEWGQTKELGFTTKNINSFGAPAVPTGWSCVRAGNKFRITAPASGSASAELPVKITFSATASNKATITRELTVSVKMPQEIDVRANSVIITQPNKRFKFNALRRGNETSNSIVGATSATRVWSTSKTAIVNISLENGYIYFATGTTTPIEEANAVIAVTDANGNALWSWHIWMTDFDPAADPDVIGGRRVMNRNLGAFASSDASSEDAVRSYGLYYQWGRKDPFVGPREWNSNVPLALYNNSGSFTTHTYVKSTDDVDMNGDKKNDIKAGTQEFATARPSSFIAGNADNGFDWLNTSNTGLWSETSKSLYDPCPAGWRVAPREIWAAFTTTGGATDIASEFNVEGEYKYGWNFVNGDDAVFFPAAGRRSFSPSLAKPEDNFTNVVNDAEGAGRPVGFYWSGARPGDGASLAFRYNHVNPGARVEARELSSPASGFSVRCVAE
jgi:hypothetical protein